MINIKGVASLLLFAGLITGCAGSTNDKDTTQPERVMLKPSHPYYLSVQDGYRPQFFGQAIITSDPTTATGSMMYPMNGAGSGLVAVLLHAAVQNNINDKRSRRAVEEANAVLEPYYGYINKLQNRGVLHDGLNPAITDMSDGLGLVVRMADDATDHRQLGWLVDLKHHYYLTRSEDALGIVAEVTVSNPFLSAANATGKAQVVSLLSDSVFDASEWHSREGAMFVETADQLLIDATDLALRQYAGRFPTISEQQQTIRYFENGKKKVERGFILQSNCRYVLFKTLNDELKRMPSLSRSRPEDCHQQEPELNTATPAAPESSTSLE